MLLPSKPILKVKAAAEVSCTRVCLHIVCCVSNVTRLFRGEQETFLHFCEFTDPYRLLQPRALTQPEHSHKTFTNCRGSRSLKGSFHLPGGQSSYGLLFYKVQDTTAVELLCVCFCLSLTFNGAFVLLWEGRCPVLQVPQCLSGWICSTTSLCVFFSPQNNTPVFGLPPNIWEFI